MLEPVWSLHHFKAAWHIHFLYSKVILLYSDGEIKLPKKEVKLMKKCLPSYNPTYKCVATLYSSSILSDNGIALLIVLIYELLVTWQRRK